MRQKKLTSQNELHQMKHLSTHKKPIYIKTKTAGCCERSTENVFLKKIYKEVFFFSNWCCDKRIRTKLKT